MAAHWTPKDDEFLVEFFDAIGAQIGPHDLKRSEAAAKARVKHLKATGAWDAYVRARGYRAKAMRLAGHYDPFDIIGADERRMAEMPKEPTE